MKNKEVRVLILGCSGYLGKGVFKLLESTEGVNVQGTYYENKPRWTDDKNLLYFNAGVSALDEEMLENIKLADYILDFTWTERKDYIDNLFFNMPFTIAEIATSNNGTYVSFNSTEGQGDPDSIIKKTSNRFANVLTEKELGLVIYLSPVISSESRIVPVIKALTKYKITPILGDGSNKIDAIHQKDFTLLVRRLILSGLSRGRFRLHGSSSMTVRHLFNVIAGAHNQPKPIFINISKNIFIKYKKAIETIFDTKIDNYTADILNYKEGSEGSSLAKKMKVKTLSFDGRAKREGW